MLVDENDHVDREGAARAGVGFYGKNTMLITRTHGSWVVLGTLVTDQAVEPTPPLELDCGQCRLCIDACPTGALDEPGVLDATRCLSYWTQAPAPIPEAYREELGAMVYGCDICQDVCPWNRGVEKRRGPRRSRREPRRADRVAARLAGGRRRRAARRATGGSTSRATTLAGCDETRSSRSATWAAPGDVCRGGAVPRRRRRDAARDRRRGRSRAWPSGACEQAVASTPEAETRMSDVDRLAVLAHELRSPIAALMAIEETLRAAGADISEPELRRMLQLAVAAGRDVERLLADPELFSVERRPVDLAVLLAGLRGDRVDVDVDAGARRQRRPGAATASACQPRRERAAPRRSRDRHGRRARRVRSGSPSPTTAPVSPPASTRSRRA